MWEAIGELFIRLLEGWLSWRFYVVLVTVVLIGVFVMPHVPEGVPSAVVAGLLLAIGIGVGLWWEAKRD